MGYEAVKETKATGTKGVINRTHPPVVVTMQTEATQPFDKGTILVKGGAALVPMAEYDPDASPQQEAVGVAVSSFDPSSGDQVEVLIHGTVNKGALLATEEQIELLVSQKEIYAI